VDTKCIKKVKEVKKKIEIQVHENSVGNIVSDSDNNTRYYVSIDIGKRNCVACISDKEGMIIEETKYGNTLSEAKDFAQHIDQKYNSTNCIAVVESTANMWIKTYKALEQSGIQTKLANPFKTRVIAEARIKTDKLDARILCHLLRSNLIPESYVAPDSIREDRSILRLRINLVQDRTRVVNRLHSLLDKYDVNCDDGGSHLVGKKGMRWLKSLKLDGNDQILLNNYISNIEFLNEEIIQIDKKVSLQAVKTEDVKILMSITGIDYFSAMLIMSEIGDITRFNHPSKLVSWSGLCPTIHQSGNSLYMGRMKDGNKKIRWIMIQAANTAVRTDKRMKNYYAKIVKRQGHSVAITHVANKMMRIMWYMLKNKENYKDGKPELYQRKLKRING
jgi:transposase